MTTDKIKQTWFDYVEQAATAYEATRQQRLTDNCRACGHALGIHGGYGCMSVHCQCRSN